MNLTRRSLLALAGMGGIGLAACKRERIREEEPPAPVEEQEPVEEVPEEPEEDFSEFEDLALDMDAWLYDKEHDCYYQLALPYCLKPGSEQYESLAIFVPGAYFEGTEKGRTYSCTIVPNAQVGQFSPATAPIAMPINTPSCSAQECPTSYSYEGLDRYLKAGIVYVYAGFRGRSGGYESTTQEYFSGGAPWLVADLKAAVRCLRYNASVLPCDVSRIFVFGSGGGGGIGSLLGVSGNASVFQPYLEALGAATHDIEGTDLSDDVYGLATWCTMGSFESADAAYEWMMGRYSSVGTREEGTWTKMLSDDLADAYGAYVNSLGLVDDEGTLLQLDRIDDGTYSGGTYYDHLMDVISDAAEDFIGRMEFPYAEVPLETSPRIFPGNPSLGSASASSEETTADEENGSTSPSVRGVHQIQATVYDTLEGYISTLNGGNRWITYNPSTGTADITGLWGFVTACRQPNKDVCAYDHIDRSGLANQLFGTDEQPTLHYDAMVSDLLERQHERYAKAKGWDDKLVSEWRGDLVETDVLEKTVQERVAMSDPLAFLDEAGAEGSAPIVAPYWRMNTGLFQPETTLVGEYNLSLALAAHEGVKDVSFQAVWDAGFELAERTGDPEDNLVAWIVSCCPEQASAASDDTTSEADAETEKPGTNTKESEDGEADSDATATDAEGAAEGPEGTASASTETAERSEPTDTVEESTGGENS